MKMLNMLDKGLGLKRKRKKQKIFLARNPIISQTKFLQEEIFSPRTLHYRNQQINGFHILSFILNTYEKANYVNLINPLKAVVHLHG